MGLFDIFYKTKQDHINEQSKKADLMYPPSLIEDYEKQLSDLRIKLNKQQSYGKKISPLETVRGLREKKYYMELTEANILEIFKSRASIERFNSWLITHVVHAFQEEEATEPFKLMDPEYATFNIETKYDMVNDNQVIHATVSGQVFKELCWGSTGPKAIEAFGIALAKMGKKIQLQIKNMPKTY